MSDVQQSVTVSVCLITYNHEAYLAEALEGIVKQKTSFNIEVIIGEDFSTDNTRKVCETYQQKYPELIRLLPSDRNYGIMPNLKRTLEAARGRYIALCEGDDYWVDLLKLQKQVDFLEANPAYVATYHDVKVIDSSGAVIRKSKNSALNKIDFSADDLMKGRVMSLQSLCYRNVIREYPPEIYHVLTVDKFLCSMLGQYGKGKYLDNVAPAAYRLHNGGVWSLKDNVQKKMALITSYYWMWQYYARIKNNELALHFFNMIMREGFFYNPYTAGNAGKMDKFEFVVLRTLRKIFAILRRLF
jgi:glycosyltransferase involved in cell wall biosynthesis